MAESALILTYHAIERGPAPLCVDPDLFRDHLASLADAGACVLTVSELGDAVRSGSIPERGVCLTFDDGFSSVATTAGPLMAEHGYRGTVFCVAGHLGASNDWPTQPAGAARQPLADVGALRELAEVGFEVGCHGMTHAPLSRLDPSELRRELVESRDLLAQRLGLEITSVAYPYNVPPPASARALVEGSYSAACVGGLRRVSAAADPLALPRIDAHYLRRPSLLRAAAAGAAGGYLRTRRAGARVRRLAVSDYVPA